VPDNGYHGVNADFFRQHMGPKDTEAAHRVNVSVRTHGPTKAQYRCICDEVGETEGGVIEFEVREPPRRGAPETDTAGSWRGGSLEAGSQPLWLSLFRSAPGGVGWLWVA
jgi:hypothetical protein